MSVVRHRDFAVSLRRAMDHRSVGVVALATTVGKNRVTVRNWLNGDFLPDTPTAFRISEALNDTRLYQMVLRRREGVCRYCGRTTIAISNRPRVWCNPTCRDRFRYSRVPRVSPEAKAIAAMCRECEPGGTCFTTDCPLRAWSPLPLAPDELLPLAPSNTARRRAA